MTARSRWLVLLGIAGFGLGILRNQNALAWSSLSILVWLFAEWLWFYWRVWRELPALQFTRQVNGRTKSTGLVWAGRTISVSVEMTSGTRRQSPVLTIRDCLPENLEITSGKNEWAIISKSPSNSFRYEGRARGIGKLVLPGIRLRLQDAQGFFVTERFIPLKQTLRVLSAYASVNDSQPLVKRMNSLPQHGIHRLQRAGMGSELLELREYVPGDPPKSIAWKVSARRDMLMTRQYESEVPVRVYLFVDGSIGTRTGGFGRRLIDQMSYVAGSVARSAISAGDPVGAVLLDERGQRRIRPAGGERGFHNLLEQFTDFAVPPNPPAQQLSPALINAAMRLCGEHHPELLHPQVNHVPFTFFPIAPWKRRRVYRRTLLANVMAGLYGLSVSQIVDLVHDDRMMAQFAQRLLNEAGVSWMPPLVETRSQGFHDGMATMELLSKAITESVATARDNEVYVVLADLLECATNISHVLPAIKLALARHHRVVFVCPTPAFRRPQPQYSTDVGTTARELLEQAEGLRSCELANRLQRELRRLGASVALSGEQEAIRMVLAETELARGGRVAFTGVR
ncbi:MAG: DUF58 domain-containing protein [Fuerstiella sp.]|nr:DUF58 domain-containing protein [Fuerstiella sp.]MCP4859442.1 DUF58 domain-containing protein [Fuerstiella sp.]